ncbi:hypothetical protein [Actinokineospora enzanensis]|uniref:hypothetical protein n=1 Tax=Actinokineospora enzanensis TaxID=155975 RepID=UPI000369CD3B|nr:hypothetical protein [Actinokineospora enzanensis]
MAEPATDTSGRDAHRRAAPEIRGAAMGTVSRLIRLVGLLVAFVLVIHVVLVMGNVDPANPIASAARVVAEPLALAFKTLFTPEDRKLGLLINYSLAVVFWLALSSAVSRLVRRLG